MDISSGPQHTVIDSRHLPLNGAPASASLSTPRDDPIPDSSAHSLPSTRQVELETLLRQRDAQNEQLIVEVTTLRRCLAKQPPPSTTEPVTLPHPLLSLLLPYLADPLTMDLSTSSSNSVIVALRQRAELLQEENDELYGLLKRSETGRLKEEVRGLRRAVRKMEAALKESHGIIQTLSLELDKCYETISRTSDAYASSGPQQPFPEASGQPRAHTNHTPSSSVSATKPIPTGPRAQKRRRLSHQSLSPQQPLRSLPTTHANPPSPRRTHTTLPSNLRQGGSTSRMDQDEDSRGRMTPDREWQRERGRGRDREGGRDIPPHQLSRRSKERERERERERDRDRDRDRDRGREWERERGGRRAAGGGRDRRASRGSTSTNGVGNRGLAERMGL